MFSSRRRRSSERFCSPLSIREMLAWRVFMMRANPCCVKPFCFLAVATASPISLCNSTQDIFATSSEPPLAVYHIRYTADTPTKHSIPRLTRGIPIYSSPKPKPDLTGRIPYKTIKKLRIFLRGFWGLIPYLDRTCTSEQVPPCRFSMLKAYADGHSFFE